MIELNPDGTPVYSSLLDGWIEQIDKHPTECNYFLDFIDVTSSLSNLSVENIGRRSAVESREEVNCVFAPEIPNLILLESGAAKLQWQQDYAEANQMPYVIVSQEIYTLFRIGSNYVSAYDVVRDMLYQYTSYAETIQLTVIPLYWLDVNQRITINIPQLGIYGDYIISSITTPMESDGTMSISAAKVIEKL